VWDEFGNGANAFISCWRLVTIAPEPISVLPPKVSVSRVVSKVEYLQTRTLVAAIGTSSVASPFTGEDLIGRFGSSVGQVGVLGVRETLDACAAERGLDEHAPMKTTSISSEAQDQRLMRTRLPDRAPARLAQSGSYALRVVGGRLALASALSCWRIVNSFGRARPERRRVASVSTPQKAKNARLINVCVQSARAVSTTVSRAISTASAATVTPSALSRRSRFPFTPRSVRPDLGAHVRVQPRPTRRSAVMARIGSAKD
jgi:hypothetical protein